MLPLQGLINLQSRMHPNKQEQIDTHKSYETHIQRLSDIRQGRQNILTHSYRNHSSSLNNCSPYSYNNKYAYQHHLPLQDLTRIKQKKHQTFINQYNTVQQKICEDNIKLFEKLAKQKQRKSSKSNNYHHYIKKDPNMADRSFYNFSTELTNRNGPKTSRTSYNKMYAERLLTKENQRLKGKIRGCESTLSHNKLKQSEKSRQRIKNRLLRYNNNFELKSTTYIKPYLTKTVSLKKKNPYESLNQTTRTNCESSRKPKLASFYNTQSIRRNKIQNYNIKEKEAILRKSNHRARSIKYPDVPSSFFTTDIGGR